MKVWLNMRRISLLAWLLAGLSACAGNAPEVRLEGKTTASGQQYSVFHPQGLAIQVTTSRPDVADRRVQLSVAGAYTDLDTDQPLDLLVANGQVLQPTAKVGFLDGVLTIIGDSLTISQIPKGQSPPGAEVARVQRQRGTLLLQELLVYRGRSVRGPGGSFFQRRALVELAGHQWAVVESQADITMQQFAADLVELGAQQALNLDTGGWDEGWYRAGGQVVKLGNRRTDTARQSNWLVFARRAGNE
ncbi:phosphodiester glycosidase family protein [Hymenobacter sp. DH14]|uniref:Phosphodiester glycosidase family protein n=1 Tax=Hymenobacter cyanobacteriorum TaxID=2926463 RepID=A0A9X2AEX2_9BACT|nr:phosphodiester glycosidase family protein [Hymenobacter cyanobacteriorum]MCI1187671.1 phosphodiester glycosidase family protein [Hymenobacter cyanobacteriorum]